MGFGSVIIHKLELLHEMLMATSFHLHSNQHFEQPFRRFNSVKWASFTRRIKAGMSSALFSIEKLYLVPNISNIYKLSVNLSQSYKHNNELNHQIFLLIWIES